MNEARERENTTESLLNLLEDTCSKIDKNFKSYWFKFEKKQLKKYQNLFDFNIIIITFIFVQLPFFVNFLAVTSVNFNGAFNVTVIWLLSASLLFYVCNEHPI